MTLLDFFIKGHFVYYLCCCTIFQNFCVTSISVFAMQFLPHVYKCVILYYPLSLATCAYQIRLHQTLRCNISTTQINMSLKVDLLPEIQSSPRVLANYSQSLNNAGIKQDLDQYLKSCQPVTFLLDLKSKCACNRIEFDLL